MTTSVDISRRDFLTATAIGALAFRVRQPSMRDDERFAFIGTYTNDTQSKGIYRLYLNTTTGAMRLDGVAAASKNPSFLTLHPNGRVLYVVNEVGDYGGKPTGACTLPGAAHR